jgi:hypothetical protein
MTNGLGDFLLVTVCLFGGIASLLVLLVAIDPEPDRAGGRHDHAPTPRRRPGSASSRTLARPEHPS